jgi:hypothetical protein
MCFTVFSLIHDDEITYKEVFNTYSVNKSERISRECWMPISQVKLSNPANLIVVSDAPAFGVGLPDFS